MQSGALKLESQHKMSALSRVSAKALVLLAAWMIASAAPIVALLLWKAYGGTVYVPELITVGGGHLLNCRSDHFGRGCGGVHRRTIRRRLRS